MNFKQCKLDGQDILKDGESGIYYVTKEWRRLVTDDSSENVQGVHKRTVTPTYARKRVITLEGYIDGLGNNDQQSSETFLETIFALQTDPSELIPKELYIKDSYDQEWLLNVKIKTPIEFLEATNDFVGYAKKWRVVLESVEDPVYRSANEFEIIGTDGVYGGVAFPMSTEFSLISYSNILELTIVGSQASPIRWEIEVINDIQGPLSIANISTGEHLKFNIDAQAGDVIVIDANTLQATKNNANILASRIIGSHRLTVQGTQLFSVSDTNGALPTNDLLVKAYFRESLL